MSVGRRDPSCYPVGWESLALELRSPSPAVEAFLSHSRSSVSSGCDISKGVIYAASIQEHRYPSEQSNEKKSIRIHCHVSDSRATDTTA